MLCPFCGHLESKVVNSRQNPRGDAIRRRRECLECGHRFTTFEMIEKTPIIVVKRDSKREAFDREKVIKGVLRACEKRPVTMDEIERLVQNVEKNLHNSMEKEISSLKIGELTLSQLRGLDEVAYVRFASVYRQFRDISEFNQELKDLMKTEV